MKTCLSCTPSKVTAKPVVSVARSFDPGIVLFKLDRSAHDGSRRPFVDDARDAATIRAVVLNFGYVQEA
jgi:hypothetical protein